jgi:hypothetical protein
MLLQTPQFSRWSLPLKQEVSKKCLGRGVGGNLASIIRVRIQSVSVFKIRIHSNNSNTEESLSFANRIDSCLGQLEDTFGYKKWGEKGGTLLSHKLFIEDIFIRKFLKVRRFPSRTFLSRTKTIVQPIAQVLRLLFKYEIKNLRTIFSREL